ncbi:G-type lectin S-receptor-like serine/threonine-protein kinase At4g27290 [Lactuca sativa]|uniref:Receptor-like serine/threonine-protein kinase n=1 Tax=Lactuca sativa TaxID=4236 RepID=A0A9R1XT81_LACSA|nr:G-type lectin S-receptor-like serine/threonine-protein kinase At4g27290 [Lactuca sativa]KAJ0220804.1 hypothetical protein LSAT_V11C200092190 [Lactuca sativa]
MKWKAAKHINEPFPQPLLDIIQRPNSIQIIDPGLIISYPKIFQEINRRLQNTSMRTFQNILFLSSVLFLLLTISAAVDTITTDKEIRDNDTLVSDGEMYEFGFFTPGNSRYRYLGIWYKKILPQTVVWVANRETPLTDTSGVFKVNSMGTLLLLNGNNTLIWSSNSSLSVTNVNIVAKLLDSGNLVVHDNSSSTDEDPIWQSFDYPTDTLLSGMKFGKDFITGINRCLTSWKSLDDPSPGLYVSYWDTNGYPQAFQRRGSVITLRFGPWNGVRVNGFPSKPNPIYTYDFVMNDKEVYSIFYLINTSFLSRVVIGPEGHEMRLNWNDPTQGWVPYLAATVDICAPYGLCGSYGSCNINSSPVCSCMEGFEPKHPKEWNAGDWSGGCQRKKPLKCGNEDGFQAISGLKFPDTRKSWYNLSMNLGECKRECKKNCSCTAYANVDIRRGGSGCLLWFNDLMDIREADEDQDLYIRMAASELTGVKSGFNQKKVIKVALTTSFGFVLICLAVVGYVWKKNWSQAQSQGTLVKTLCEDYTGGGQNNDVELPFFSFSEVSKLTNNFSIDNKLGQGGFGPVYKGVREDGREIAVKRLSETSTQGLVEFTNEVRCIQRLQHRNLVKLLGFCAQKNEFMLIYEYMPNRSLDQILFDETRSSMLDWNHRFRIISGIARGLLYLHQDSRLRIIHRDLKAGNILLDNDMNPKISDFGLARRFKGYETGSNTKNVVGTYGYIPPEYAVHGIFSTKSDVFSFGVLVLEIVSGMKNREFSSQEHGDNLLGHAWRLYKDDKSLDLVSGSLRESCIILEVLRSIHIGLLCVQNQPEDRPTMSSVVLMLGNDGVLPQPKPPAFFTEPDLHLLAPTTQQYSAVNITTSLTGR